MLALDPAWWTPSGPPPRPTCRPPARHPPPAGLPPSAHPRPRLLYRILIRPVTGCSWDVAARLSTASETTLRNRRTEWLAAGVFDKVLTEALAAYDRVIGLDLSDVAVDGSLHVATR